MRPKPNVYSRINYKLIKILGNTNWLETKKTLPLNNLSCKNTN